MSRRTKLIALAIFMVLLGVPLGYVAITWHPANPLRFRVVEVHDHAAMKELTGDRTLMRVEVGNTSAARVHLYFGHVSSPDRPVPTDGELGYINPEFQLEGETSRSREKITLQPHSATFVTALVHHSLVDAAKESRLSMHYVWMSQSKEKVESALHWIFSHAPSFAMDFSPSSTPGEDVAPLEPTR